jgi:hypothetical protein
MRAAQAAAGQRAIAAAKRGVDQAAALVADARAAIEDAHKDVEWKKKWVDDATTEHVDDTRAAAALQPGDEKIAVAVEAHDLMKEEKWLKRAEVALKDRENALSFCEAWLKDREVGLAKARVAAQPSSDAPAGFRLVAPDVALECLGELGSSKRFEVPTQALGEATRHVRTLRDLLGRPVDKSVIPNLVVAAPAGAGTTTLLRYLQQTADTVRYGAELQSDTNWLAKGWGAAGDASQSAPALRHVFVGFATFAPSTNEENDRLLDTEAMIERRCAWRILDDAGLAFRWTQNFCLDFAQTARMLRARISTAKGCEADEVAIVFLIDKVTNIPDGPRRILLDAIAAWQQQDLAAGRLSVSVAAGVSLFDVGDQWPKGSRSTAALPLRPLVEVPRFLAAEVAKDARLDRSRKLELLGHMSMAGGHPRTLEHVAQAMKDPGRKVWSLPVSHNVEEFMCVWNVFADSMMAGYSVDVRDFATAPEYKYHRRLLDRGCLRRHFEPSVALPRIVLSVSPSALFLEWDPVVWTEHRRTGAAFPSCRAVDAVRGLMQATDGVAEWTRAFVGALNLTAQCVLYARLKQAGTPWLPGQKRNLRGSVPFKDLVPGAIIGCQCADLRYVVRDDVSDTECGGEAVVVPAQCKVDRDATEQQVDEWFDAAAEYTRSHTKRGNFRVLICATGLPQEALDSIKKRAANKQDRLSRSIIVDPASAPQFFERFGLWTFMEALKYCRLDTSKQQQK